MSDHTKAALEQALQDHILDVTEGNLLTDWALIAASTQMDDIWFRRDLLLHGRQHRSTSPSVCSGTAVNTSPSEQKTTDHDDRYRCPICGRYYVVPSLTLTCKHNPQ